MSEEDNVHEKANPSELAESLEMLERSMEDIREGRTYPAKQALHDIAAKLGVELKRPK